MGVLLLAIAWIQRAGPLDPLPWAVAGLVLLVVGIVAQVGAAVAGAAGRLVTLFVPHTTAGIIVQAAGDGAVEVAAERLVSEDWPWRHTSEGDRNRGRMSAPV